MRARLGGFDNVVFFQSGWDAQKPFGRALKGMLEEPYTLFAAFIGSTFHTMATHGTDQDMVQRMLTATDYKKSRFSLICSGLADIPLVMAFLTVGILLWVYYQGNAPKVPDNEIFAHYIIHEMPTGMRGLIVAGVFATMMGSTSAALNALATSYTKDFYQPYINPTATESQAIRAARVATAVFGILMILVATMAAYLVLKDPKLTIIPIALGIFGFTYGALLGVFLVGMLTRTRGADKTNIIGMLLGVVAVLVLCKIELPLFGATIKFGGFMPDWWPKIAWSWYVLVGCIATFAFCVLFRTPRSQIAAAEAHVGSAPPPTGPSQGLGRRLFTNWLDPKIPQLARIDLAR